MIRAGTSRRCRTGFPKQDVRSVPAVRLGPETRALRSAGTRVRQHDRRSFQYGGMSRLQCVVSGSAAGGFELGTIYPPNYYSNVLEAVRRRSGKRKERHVPSPVTVVVQAANSSDRKTPAIDSRHAMARHRVRIRPGSGVDVSSSWNSRSRSGHVGTCGVHLPATRIRSPCRQNRGFQAAVRA